MLKNLVERAQEDVVRDYDDFCVKWGDRVRNIVVSKGCFELCDVDDITQDLLAEFVSKDYLSVYDPEKGSKFSTFIYNFTNRRLLGKRDRYVKKIWREGLSLSKTLDAETGETFLDNIEDVSVDVSFEFLSTVKSIYRQLLETPVTSTVNNFPKLFSAVIEQMLYGIPESCVLALGEVEADKNGRYGINRKALAFQLGVSESGVSIMLGRLAEIPAVRSLLPD